MCKILCGDKFKFEPEQADYLSKQKTVRVIVKRVILASCHVQIRKMEEENSVTTWER